MQFMQEFTSLLLYVHGFKFYILTSDHLDCTLVYGVSCWSHWLWFPNAYTVVAALVCPDGLRCRPHCVLHSHRYLSISELSTPCPCSIWTPTCQYDTVLIYMFEYVFNHRFWYSPTQVFRYNVFLAIVFMFIFPYKFLYNKMFTFIISIV